MLFIGIFVILAYLISQPLLVVIYFKLRYGKRVIVQYFPVLGLSRPLNKSRILNNDPLYSITKLITENRQADILITNLIFKPLIVFLKPEYYKVFMQNHHEYDKFHMIVDRRLCDKGMIMERGQKWQQQRKLLGSHFEYSKLITLIPMINEVTDQKLSVTLDKEFSILPIVSSITGEVVLRAFFGQDIAKLSLNGEDPTKSVTQLFTRFGQLIVNSPFFLFKRAFLEEKVFTIFPRKVEKDLYNLNTEMLNHMKKAINNRLDRLKNQKVIEYQDYLDVYLDAYLNGKMDPPITEDEILQQSITLYFAGTETTANLVTTTCYYLAEKQDLQKELYEEIKQVIGQEQVITAKHLQGLQKVTGFIMECLRLRPVAPMVISKKSLKDHYINDVFIKKGWYVNYMAVSNQLNDKYFPNPKQFDISRWKADGTPKDTSIDPFAFIPFSAGGRNCIGQHLAMIESKIILSKILMKYKLSLNEKIIQTDWILKITYGLSNKEYLKWELR